MQGSLRRLRPDAALLHERDLFVDHVALVVGVLRSEEHTSELQSQSNLVCRLLLEKKKHQSSTLSQQEGHLLPRYGASHPLVVNMRAQERDVDRRLATVTPWLPSRISS